MTAPRDRYAQCHGDCTTDCGAWRPIPGYEGAYEVSDHGVVRSLPREDSRGHSLKGRVLSPGIDDGGYPIYSLWLAGRGRSHRAHSLVMAAFVGPLPDGELVRHLDGDQTNNAVTNLVYGTCAENQMDTVRHGTNANSLKTECPQGHSYEDPANLIVYRTSRYCRTCQTEYKRRYDAQRKASA